MLPGSLSYGHEPSRAIRTHARDTTAGVPYLVSEFGWTANVANAYVVRLSCPCPDNRLLHLARPFE